MRARGALPAAPRPPERPVALNPRIEDLRRRLEKEPGSRIFAQLAEELRKEGDFAEAIRVSRSGLAQHPSYPSARMTLGRALFDSGDLAGGARGVRGGVAGRAGQHPGQPIPGRVSRSHGRPRLGPAAVSRRPAVGARGPAARAADPHPRAEADAAAPPDRCRAAGSRGRHAAVPAHSGRRAGAPSGGGLAPRLRAGGIHDHPVDERPRGALRGGPSPTDCRAASACSAGASSAATRSAPVGSTGPQRWRLPARRASRWTALLAGGCMHPSGHRVGRSTSTITSSTPSTRPSTARYRGGPPRRSTTARTLRRVQGTRSPCPGTCPRDRRSRGPRWEPGPCR